MKISELIGQKLIKVVESDVDQVRLIFEGGTLTVAAVGDSWHHAASLYLEVDDDKA